MGAESRINVAYLIQILLCKNLVFEIFVGGKVEAKFETGFGGFEVIKSDIGQVAKCLYRKK